MLLIRRSDDADGDSKMIGSSFDFGFLLAEGTGTGTGGGATVPFVDGGALPLKPRKKGSEDLRTWEKSCETS